MLRALGRWALRLAGWTVRGQIPPLPKFVAVVAPHTSNWDFVVGVAAMFALDLRVNWLGKHTLFRWPIGGVLRWLGGRPVRRDAPEGVVADIAATIREQPRFILALAPEGTRRRVEQWRTGFYHIAQAAHVPIVPVALDWGHREIVIGDPADPVDDAPRAIAALQRKYRREMARHPDQFWTGP